MGFITCWVPDKEFLANHSFYYQIWHTQFHLLYFNGKFTGVNE